MDLSPAAGLEEQVRELRLRVRRLEQALEVRGIFPASEAELARLVARVPASQPGPPAEYRFPPPPEAYPTPAPLPFSMPEEAPLRDERSLENRIGSQWFNRIGILALLIGMAWFLKLAIDNRWIGPLGRVLIGLVAGGALIAWSERFQRRGYAAFGYSLKAVGSGILYLSLWAAFSLYHLMPPGVAFAAMIAVTAFNGFLAWVQDAELLALYAIAGGLSTPLLLSTGGNHEVTLLTYLLMLDVAVLALVVLRPWSRLLFAAFLGTVLFLAGWSLEFYSESQRARTAWFLTGFFLIFAFAPRLVRIEMEGGGPASLWDNLALVALPIANAALGFLGYYALFDSVSHEWGGACVAVALAGFYLLLIRLPHRGLLRPSTELVSSLHLTVAIVLLTLAIPLRAHGRWLTLGWLAEGAALLWLAASRRSLLLRALALGCLVLGLAALVTVDLPAAAMPLLNQRFGTYLAAIAVFTIAARTALAALSRHEEDRDAWRTIAGGAILVGNALILLAFSLEIHSYWWSVRWRGDGSLLAAYQMYAQFTYSALFMVFGAVLLGVGFWQRSAFVRWQALVLLAVAIGKVFLADVSQLSQGYRIVSFLGLGALLLAVSFVYQRDWLHLRPAERRPQ